jgi:hypothetical protein
VTTIGVAMWMADTGKHMFRRCEHLLAKQGVSAWVWVVRPTNDCTAKLLGAVRDGSPVPVMLIEEQHGQPEDRIMSVSIAADIGLNAALSAGADRVLYHESDLISDDDIVAKLSGVLDASPAAGIVGGWPCLASKGMPESLRLFPGDARLGECLSLNVDDSEPTLPFFYDSWGYRHEGKRFASVPPYSPCYRADEPFMLDSVGSVALIDCEYLRRGARMEVDGFVGLCSRIRTLGGEVWCDPRVLVSQPLELWTFQNN